MHININTLMCMYCTVLTHPRRAGCGAIPCILVSPLPSPQALSLQSLRVILRANGGQSDAGNDQLQS